MEQCSACQTKAVSEIKQCYSIALGILGLSTLECRDFICTLCLPTMHTMHTNYEPANWMDEMQCVLDACLECVYMQLYHTIVQMLSVDVRVHVRM